MGFLGELNTFAPWGSPATPGRRIGKSLGCTMHCSGLCRHREPWRCQPAPRHCRHSPNCSHTSPNLQVTPPPLLSAPQDLFSPLPSPALLTELLHQAQGKQKMGQRAIWGTKAAWASLVRIISFQLTKLLNRSNLLVLDCTAKVGVQCNEFACSVRQQITKHRPPALIHLLQAECRGGEPCQDLCVLSLLRGLRQKERQFQAADRGTESSLQPLWLHFTKVCVYRASPLPAKCKHDP